ncbi:LysE family transporter [candidate division KSB1 bacterium]|nr:LysE family transporter [candidate division KSB1 bacterium]
MSVTAITAALGIGIIAAIPVGPLNVFAISQTLRRDFLHGFLVGITASILDGVYFIIAFIGLSYLTEESQAFLPALKIIGTLLLLAVAVRLLLKAREVDLPQVECSGSTVYRPILTALLLYLTNPFMVVFWLAVAGVVSAHEWISEDMQSAGAFASFIVVGSAVWYYFLIRYVSRTHHQLSPRAFKRILTTIAVILFAFALYTALSI